MTTDANDHDALREQVALYAVGALSGPERATVEAHLRQCDECAADLQAPLAVLTAPDVRQIRLAGQPVAPNAAARVYWSRSRGLVFTGTNLPKAPAGRIYQLWFVTPNAAISAGLLNPDDSGRPI